MPAADPRDQPLVDDAGQRGGELHADLGLLLGREDVDHAGERLGGVVGVQGREDQVAGLGDGQREPDRLEVAHLADQQHVGVLAQRGAQRVGERAVSVPTSRWLTAERLWSCTYSIGSSMVMMWQARLVLIWSIIEASVVDLPEPVGPVTRTRPWCWPANVP